MSHVLDILAAKFGTLPDAIQDTLADEELAQKIVAITKKYGLHLDLVEGLMDETSLVLIGETHPDEFISHVAKRLSLPREKAAQIAGDINTEVFLPVREAIKEVLTNKDKAAIEPKEEPPTAPDPIPTRASVLGGIENPELASLSGDYIHKTEPAKLSPEQAEILRGIETPSETPMQPRPEAKKETPPQEKAAPDTGNRIPITTTHEGAPYGEGTLPVTSTGEKSKETKSTPEPQVVTQPEAAPHRTPPKPPKPPTPAVPNPPVSHEIVPPPQPAVAPSVPPKAPAVPRQASSDPYREPIH